MPPTFCTADDDVSRPPADTTKSLAATPVMAVGNVAVKDRVSDPTRVPVAPWDDENTGTGRWYTIEYPPDDAAFAGVMPAAASATGPTDTVPSPWLHTMFTVRVQVCAGPVVGDKLVEGERDPVSNPNVASVTPLTSVPKSSVNVSVGEYCVAPSDTLPVRTGVGGA